MTTEPQTDRPTPGQIAYEVYGDEHDHRRRTEAGASPWPSWDSVPADVRPMWERAARAVLETWPLRSTAAARVKAGEPVALVTEDDPVGCWVAYHADWSGFEVFADELDALRHAVEHHQEVVFTPWGESPQDAARRELDGWRAAREASS